MPDCQHSASACLAAGPLRQHHERDFPALADKNLDAFAHPVRGKYAWPNGGLFRKDAEVFGLLAEAWQTAIVEDKITVVEAFTAAAARANALMAEG